MALTFSRFFMRSFFYKRNFCSFITNNSNLNKSINNQTHITQKLIENGRINDIKSLFSKYGFSRKEIYSFTCFNLKNPNTNTFSISDIEERIIFWHENIYEENSTNTNFNISANVNRIITRISPELLYIDIPLMKTRIQDLLNIGFISGRNQLCLLFIKSPIAFFLQDWNEFRKKFYYLQYRVVEWLLIKQKDKYPDPHPIVEYPHVMEREYNFIKSRYKFAIATGITTPDKFIDENGNIKLINFEMLFTEDIAKYLSNISPYCRKEEYLVFEQLINAKEDDEDNIFEDLGQGLKANDSEIIDKDDSLFPFKRLKGSKVKIKL